MSPGIFLYFFENYNIVSIKILIFSLAYFNSFFNKQLFFRFISECQTEILRWSHLLQICAIFLDFLGLPQRSVLCPLFFVIYASNHSNNIASTVKQQLMIYLFSQLIMLKLQLMNEFISKIKSGWTSIEKIIFRKLYFHGKWQNYFAHKSVSAFRYLQKFI